MSFTIGRFTRRATPGLLGAALLALSLGAGPADPPSALETTPLPPGIALARLAWNRAQKLEAVEMLTAMIKGSQMGPRDGWFHGSSSRYTPLWLAQRFDSNGDWTITAEEFTGPAEWFDRFDRDQNGRLTIEDFDWSGNSVYLRQTAIVRGVFAGFDTSSNGKITRAEWDAMFERLAKGKEHLSTDDLKPLLVPPAPRPEAGSPKDAPTTLTLLEGFFKGELGSWLEGPKIDQDAPGFQLRTQDGKREVSLREFRGKTPVVLVFGSFT